MDIPYGFDCYSFRKNEIKYLDDSIKRAKSSLIMSYNRNITTSMAHQGYVDPLSGQSIPGYVKFTRKNEHYTKEQVEALTRAGRLLPNETKSQIFCGIKIQIGMGVVTSFLRRGLQYRPPNPGRAELINGSWTGIVSGLTVDLDAPNSYDIAFGNFLAYDEEFPYLKFGPFIALESKLVILTGSSRRIESSSFGTNIDAEIWQAIISFMLILSLLASFRVHWQHSKRRRLLMNLSRQQYQLNDSTKDQRDSASAQETLDGEKSIITMVVDFFFIYFTMLLNKPCLEFDDLIWPKQDHHHHHRPSLTHDKVKTPVDQLERSQDLLAGTLRENELRKVRKRKRLPTSVRIVSYLWSAACFVMASIFSGEMLAVILLHTDQNIDTVSQLINVRPQIEPVIRQDDFTYNLMLKSLDPNMLTLYNMTKIIPRPEVYTRRFIESVSQRKQALLGDDELIETIYEIYHKYFPLYRSKVTYLQYPISIMYRMDLNRTLERKLRSGMVQMFEMGLIQRWYQAQKETYIQFYDTYEKKKYNSADPNGTNFVAAEPKYKPMTLSHFRSFFKLMLICVLFAFAVLVLELIIGYEQQHMESLFFS